MDASRKPSVSIEPRRRSFQDLMPQRVRRILLVATLYDSFILTEDGHLNEALLRQFLDLNLNQLPDLRRVSDGEEAIRIVQEQRFDLVISSMQVGDTDAAALARRIHEAGLDIPVIMLAYNNRALTDFLAQADASDLERTFLWQGDVRILLAMVKYVEDRLNVEHDTGQMGVPVIIVVEDNVRYYSSFLPEIYAELVRHTHSLVSEGLNLSQKMVRTRARPKILLCTTYEEAWGYIEAYEEQIVGVISDFEFPHNGVLHREAGLELTRRVRERRPDIPIVLQSSFPQNESLAQSVKAAFLLKGSPTMLQELRALFQDNFGFGDFVFHTPGGGEVARAHDLKSLVDLLHTVPAASIAFHGERNHFSFWLKARTEFALADKLRARRVSDYASLEELRDDLIRSIADYRHERDAAVVADFDRTKSEHTSAISRVGGGSLGGKARGLALVNRLLNDYGVVERFPDVHISVPFSVVLGTDMFDEFIEANDLLDFAIRSESDAEIEGRFQAVPFPNEALLDLRAFIRDARYPLAVRSSGLLEDSPNQPFAGVYQTFMLPNNDPDPEKRLVQLIAAVKRVYASTFSRTAKSFLRMTPYRLEEEKMAVIIQKIVGRAHDTRFYPHFAGVARSHNFYPVPPMKAEDGIVAVALGLGRTVVDGEACVRFSPAYPKHQVAFGSVDDVLKNSQRELWVLDLEGDASGHLAAGEELRRCGLEVAEADGTLAAVGSTYSPDNDVIYDGISRAGVRLVSFAPILKHDVFPLAEVLEAMIGVGVHATGSPVEIEFAINLPTEPGDRPEFGFLQLRPLALSRESEDVEIGHVISSSLLCRSATILGNGKVDLADVVVVDYERFDRSRSREVAQQVARFNGRLQAEDRPYLLIGVGRWGSADPHLGIPVSWNQIAGARVIVEAGFRDFRVTPSQGTHFFQNLTSCNVGYFTINADAGEGYIDWEWFLKHRAADETEFVRRLRLDEPVTVKMSGRTGEGVILKPGPPAS
jgi:CheY-like chemotaxis protein